MKNYQAAKARLGKLAEKIKGKVGAIGEKVRDKGLLKSNMERVAKNAEQRQNKPNGTKTKSKGKTVQKPPTPPGPKRGR